MKRLIFLLCVFIVAGSYAQDCKGYYYLQSNKTTTMGIYNKKGEPSGKVVYTVSGVSGNVATVNSEVFDKKDKSIVKSASDIKCENGIMMINMKMMVPQQQMEQFKNATSTGAVYLEYPATFNTGDTLKDGSFAMDIDNNGMKQSLMMNVTNRKVAGKESVTTPAGTWECYKITYNSKMNVRTMGIGVPMNFDGTEWFAPGFGVVKTESKYGSTMITAIE